MKKFLIPIFLFSFFPAFSFAAVFDRDLYFGLRGDAGVTKLQEFLRGQGVYSGPVTGGFFSLTQGGVLLFQSREGLPLTGAFDTVTRARANSIISRGSITPLPPAPLPPSGSETTPSFTRLPEARGRLLSTPPPLGARYAYAVTFDWASDIIGYIEESVTCSPAIKISQFLGRATEYYPLPDTSYNCSITVRNQAGSATTSQVSFRAGRWAGISGSNTISLPATASSTINLDEIGVYNSTSTQVIFSRLNVNIIDRMNAPANRGREVNLVIRKGTRATDDVLSRTPLRLSSAPPGSGENRAEVSLPFPVGFAVGDERTYALWLNLTKYGAIVCIALMILLAVTTL